MTDGLHSLSVCNETFVSVTSHYPYRPYELLTVEVSSYPYMVCEACMVLVSLFRVSEAGSGRSVQIGAIR